MVMLTRRGPSQLAPAKGRGRALLGQFAPLLVGAALLVLATLVTTHRWGDGADPVGGGQVGSAMLGQPAPDFRLTDQFGAPVSLAALRGKVVVLTFLYSNCPDVCPVTLGKFGVVKGQLGSQADEVAFLAVTVDPARDDSAQLRRYLEAQRLDQQVQFLTGDRAALEAVWAAYRITVAQGPTASGAAAGATYEVIHSDRIYLLDRDGCLQLLLRSTFAPQEMLVDLAGLLNANGGVTGSAGRCG